MLEGNGMSLTYPRSRNLKANIKKKTHKINILQDPFIDAQAK